MDYNAHFGQMSEHDSYYYKDDEDDIGPEESHMPDMPSDHLCVRIKSELGDP